MKKRKLKNLNLNKIQVSKLSLPIKGGIGSDPYQSCYDCTLHCSILCSEYPRCIYTRGPGQMGPCQIE